MSNFIQDLLIAEEVVAEIEQVKDAPVGEEQSLPPIKVKIHGHHYQAVIDLTRLD